MSTKIGFDANGDFAIGGTKPYPGVAFIGLGSRNIRTPSPATTTTSQTAIANGLIHYSAMYISQRCGIDAMTFQVMVGGTSARIALYDNDDAVIGPGSLIRESGVIDVSGTGVQTDGFSEIILDPGVYWTAINSNDGTLQVRFVTSAECLLDMGTTTATASSGFTRRRETFAFGAFPGTATPTVNSASAVAMDLRRSS